ncbi:MAG TPA: CPCC family cysteine-rich protein [Polyangiaceae bacterium]
MSEALFPCPACGHLVFSEAPGSDDICLVCFWEDDLTQLRWPALAGGKNEVSLSEAQKNVREFGAIEERFAGDVRAPSAEESLDPEWRPISPSDPFEAPDDAAPWPADSTTLYYWRPTYWRADKRARA